LTASRTLTIGEALDLGTQYAINGRHADAIGVFRGVLVHEPANFEAMMRLGSSLFETGRLHEALYCFWRGKKLAPRHPLALTNYGLALSQLGHADEGVSDLERAVVLAKKNPQTAPAVLALIHNNLGNCLERLGKYQEAFDTLMQGIRFNPDDPFPHYNIGVCLLRLNRHLEAIGFLTRSLELARREGADISRTNEADARYNRALAWLLLGNLKRGFEEYEYRLATSENGKPYFGLPPEKKWNGEGDLEGKTLLLYCEQGLGDDIQFFRFLAPLIEIAKPARIKMACHKETRVLLPDIGIEFLDHGAKIEDGDYDAWEALMSLPFCFGIESEADLKITGPYVVPQIEPARLERFGSDMKRDGNCFRVGVCWSGNFCHKNDRHRSIALDKFKALFEETACTFYSLQQIRPGEQEQFEALRQELPNLRAFEFSDFRDTAAAILNLDLVITVDTAVAHLAASLGVPTWILLPAFATDWRWQLERRDTPWYPAARLFRQAAANRWADTIEEVRLELAHVSAGSAAA
jgi:tetratricopeptide (TPR) repeat protein